jgi:hypothetical protein
MSHYFAFRRDQAMTPTVVVAYPPRAENKCPRTRSGRGSGSRDRPHHHRPDDHRVAREARGQRQGGISAGVAGLITVVTLVATREYAAHDYSGPRAQIPTSCDAPGPSRGARLRSRPGGAPRSTRPARSGRLGDDFAAWTSPRDRDLDRHLTTSGRTPRRRRDRSSSAGRRWTSDPRRGRAGRCGRLVGDRWLARGSRSTPTAPPTPRPGHDRAPAS